MMLKPVRSCAGVCRLPKLRYPDFGFAWVKGWPCDQMVRRYIHHDIGQPERADLAEVAFVAAISAGAPQRTQTPSCRPHEIQPVTIRRRHGTVTTRQYSARSCGGDARDDVPRDRVLTSHGLGSKHRTPVIGPTGVVERDLQWYFLTGLKLSNHRYGRRWGARSIHDCLTMGIRYNPVMPRPRCNFGRFAT